MVGVTILFTGIFAAISCFYALYKVFLGEAYAVPLSIAFGFLWGVFVFNLDRFLVSTVRKEGSFIKDFRNVSPRILLAIVIALVIATPLKIRIFEDRLERQIHEMRKVESERDKEFYESNSSLSTWREERSKLDSQLAAVYDKKTSNPENADLEFQRQLYKDCTEEVDRLEEEKRKNIPLVNAELEKVQTAINQEVESRQKARDDEEAASAELQDVRRRIDIYLETEATLQREIAPNTIEISSRVPSIPTGLRNERIAAQERINQVQALQRELSARINKLVFDRKNIQLRKTELAGAPGRKRQECQEVQQEITRISQQIEIAHNEWQQEIEEQIAVNTDRMNAAQEKVDAGIKEGAKAIDISYSGNFLTQLEALGKLVEKPFTMFWWIHWMISILFILVETAPILVKLLTPRSAYDSIADKVDAESEIAGIQFAVNHRKIKVAQLLKDRMAEVRTANELLFDEYQKRLLHFGDLMADNLDSFNKLALKLSKLERGPAVLELLHELYDKVTEDALRGFDKRSREIVAEEGELLDAVERKHHRG